MTPIRLASTRHQIRRTLRNAWQLTWSGSLIQSQVSVGRRVCRSRSREALGLGFDHRAEIVAPVGALLLQVEADAREVFFADGFGQQCAAGLGADCALLRMRAEQRVFAQAG